jgi:hypothetical protein
MTGSDTEQGWLPIDSAPRDGTAFLAWGYLHDDGGPYHDDGRSFMGEAPRMLIARWHKPIGGFVERMGGSYDGLLFWMPLPAAPKGASTPGRPE